VRGVCLTDGGDPLIRRSAPHFSHTRGKGREVSECAAPRLGSVPNAAHGRQMSKKAPETEKARLAGRGGAGKIEARAAIAAGPGSWWRKSAESLSATALSRFRKRPGADGIDTGRRSGKFLPDQGPPNGRAVFSFPGTTDEAVISLALRNLTAAAGAAYVGGERKKTSTRAKNLFAGYSRRLRSIATNKPGHGRFRSS